MSQIYIKREKKTSEEYKYNLSYLGYSRVTGCFGMQVEKTLFGEFTCLQRIYFIYRITHM